jgi:hypothetical protein
VSWIKNLPQEALQLGKDMINGIANGTKLRHIRLGKRPEMLCRISGTFCIFPVPDQGPLADANTYGPDFMKLYASGITNNIPKLRKTAQDAAQGVSSGLKATSTAQFQFSFGFLNRGLAYQGSSQQTGGIVFAPQLTFEGNANKAEVTAALTESYAEFKAFMARYESDKQRTKMRK